MHFNRLGNGAPKDKGAINRLQLGPGWALFQPDPKNPPAAENIPFALSHALEQWLRANPAARVRTTLPFIRDGHIAAFHIWYDEDGSGTGESLSVRLALHVEGADWSCQVSQEVQLPFAPYAGLRLTLGPDDSVVVTEICWEVTHQRFFARCEPLRASAANREKLVASLQARGWQLAKE